MRAWLSLWAAVITAAGVVGCGSSAGDSTFPNGGDLDATTDGTTNELPDAAFGTSGDDGGPAQSSHCTPRTCAQAGANCGPVADGCGGLLQCGPCTLPETCGGGGTPSVCGGKSACVPKTCADQGIECGQAGDGCGNVITCGSCKAPTTCGGGGAPSKCGGTAACTPITQCPAGMNCGVVGNGCGGVVTCGSGNGSCPGGQSCGMAGSNKCGPSGAVLPDGGPVPDGGACVATTCAALASAQGIPVTQFCGDQSNGCGGVLHCGGCTAPATCGGGGKANQCGGTAACVPKTSCPVGMNCGQIADGCGGVVTCGTGSCPSGQACGGGGVANQCGGAVVCTKKTCADYGATCGPVGDGCGGTIASCGSCTPPAICGGGGVPSQCSAGGGGQQCQGLQCQQVICDSGTTTLTGTVYDPAGKNPLYNAFVYVPNYPSQVKPFTKGVTCDQCGADVSGTPLVSAVTGPDGKFTLTNVPVGNGITVVIQLGRWRRVITVDVPACASTAVPATLTHLPRNKSEGDIPLMAISTGNADPFECLLYKMGIDAAEFTTNAGDGRINVYEEDNGNRNGTGLDDGSGNNVAPAASDLWSQQSTLMSYDIVLLPCEGSPTNSTDSLDHGPTARSNVVSYVNLGGRLFTTHYSYAWLNAAPWNAIGAWDPDQAYLSDDNPLYNGEPQTVTGILNTSFPKGQAFAQWLMNVNASPAYGQLVEQQARHDIDGVTSPTTEWISISGLATGTKSNGTKTKNSHSTQHLTFNAPLNAPLNDAGVPNYCGRVVYSDFHVSASALDSTQKRLFPEACLTGDLSAQEKALEFMLFDLSNCIQQDSLPPIPPPTCTPTTCSALAAKQGIPLNQFCGDQADGCGNVLHCGQCQAPQTCGGGGVANQCGGCVPTTCNAQNIHCGQAGDGCGNVLDCGACANGQTCGGGGVPGQCGAPSCTKETCAQQNLSCGPAGDGCGGLQQCGACASGQTCGGGGVPGQCGALDASACAPLTCKQQNIGCGPAGDGCGNQIDCGACPPGQTCGGGGVPGQCGAPSCTPRTCQQAGATCGPIADGCGGVAKCGDCTPPASCGGGGTPNQCGVPPCTPRTCQQAGANCGPIGDGCGGVINCGDCTPPQTCGGGGTASVCGGGGGPR